MQALYMQPIPKPCLHLENTDHSYLLISQSLEVLYNPVVFLFYLNNTSRHLGIKKPPAKVSLAVESYVVLSDTTTMQEAIYLFSAFSCSTI